ncbi:MAG: BspA family leucine-rich repeat surface protein [Luminiphilus sp.]|nr:BspA family leucine-rich repeat surface protein [Luminiphilus sp.]
MSSLGVRCPIVFSSLLHVTPAGAQQAQDIAVSWVAEVASAPIPTLGAYGAWLLAIMVILLIRRRFGAKPSGAGYLALTGALGSSLIGVMWAAHVFSNGSLTTVSIPADADCSGTHIFGNAERVALVNDCSDPVRVSYAVTETSNCAAQELSCAGSACAEDSELVPANGGHAEFLGCYATAPAVSLSCADTSLAEAEGTLECTLTLSRTWRQAIDVTVGYSGTATPGADYTGDTAAHTIVAGNSSASWTLAGVSDGDNAESDEVIFIEILTVNNGTENDHQSVTITMPYACIPPGTALDDGNFHAAIEAWFVDGSSSEYGSISQWCTGAVSDMSSAFQSKTDFNEVISAWDTSGVTDMSQMFYGARWFNQNISEWNVEGVTNMTQMFRAARAFDQNIGAWDTANVTDMSWLFYDARAFNQDISSWDTSNVTTMGRMFGATQAFNQDIGGWNTANVTYMDAMFYYASAFNQDLTGWCVSGIPTAPAYFDGNTFAWTVGFGRPQWGTCP